MKNLIAGVAALLLAPFLSAGSAEAGTVGITGGTTNLIVTADLAGLGLSAETFGGASLTDGAFTFPITGGSVDTESGDALIEHEGSGVVLYNMTSEVSVGSFLIDTASAAIFGLVNGTGSLVQFFDLGGTTEDGIEVLIAAPLGGAISAIFGAPDLTGATFGFATTSPVTDVAPAPVPLPAAMPLLLAGIGAMAFVRTRGRRRAA